jgi:anti-sigma regulatory factor (Ser/Thr protein kinase)
MNWSIKNDLTEIEKLAAEIETFGERHGLPSDLIFNINLSLDELITNIINYGYRDQHEHRIHIDLRVTETEVVVELKDDGIPFNPLEKPCPDVNQGLDDRPVGGLGIYLVRNLMDQVEYRRTGAQNVLTMKKILSARGEFGLH